MIRSDLNERKYLGIILYVNICSPMSNKCDSRNKDDYGCDFIAYNSNNVFTIIPNKHYGAKNTV